MKTFTVYTFWEPAYGKLLVSRVQAYTRWCPDTWSGRKVYEVDAMTGNLAKRIARKRRVADELASRSIARRAQGLPWRRGTL